MNPVRTLANDHAPQRSIALFDSGLGGLTVLRELRRRCPGESFVYLGDTARTPYGTKGEKTIIRYARECSRFLLSCEIKILVVACNTASALALHTLEEECPCPVIGTVEPAVRSALAASKSRRIGVIGTDATINSGAYEQALKRANSAVEVFSKACPLFVPLVEQGMFGGEIVDKVIELYLSPLKEARIDTLVLGCTHYPLLIDAISRFMGPGVAVVECSKAIAEDVRALLGSSENGRSEPETPQRRDHYFVTDEVGRFNYLANLFLGSSNVEAIKIEELE